MSLALLVQSFNPNDVDAKRKAHTGVDGMKFGGVNRYKMIQDGKFIH